MGEQKFYCYCENNCKYETLNKEQILTAIANAVATGSIGNCDTGFITTIKTITGQPLKFFVDTQSKYEALSKEQKENLFAIITNDTTKEGLLAAIKKLQDDYKELNEALFVTGAKAVNNAKIIKPQETYSLTINTSVNNGKTELTLENGKTYMFSVLQYQTWVYSATFILHIPAEARVRTFEDRYDLLNAGDYTAISSIFMFRDKFLRAVYNLPSKQIHIESWNSQSSVWEFYEWTRPILDIMYHEIATI